MTDIVSKLWGFCHTLRHDGVDYGDYIEQLTYLLFLKMADERGSQLPADCDWPQLKMASGQELLDHYEKTIATLRTEKGLLGDIFNAAQNRFSNPVNLKKLINLIDEWQWSELDADVKGEAFEGLLEKAASEGKKGAGQYFTPRVLIQAIVAVMQPDPRSHGDWTVCDPACGTGGFLLVAYEWLFAKTKGAFDVRDWKRIKTSTYFGQDLVARPRRLALMNMFLHGLEPQIKLGDTIYQDFDGTKFDCVLSNPPFGTRGSGQAPTRDDFTIETSNKQLNFVQHIVSSLKHGGRAAIVLPDNCLFEGKAGEVFKLVMEDCNLHTILRLPRGTFTPYVARVNRLFALADSLEARFDKAHAFFDRMSGALLAKAFRGELVPQHPDDENAAVTLERAEQPRRQRGCIAGRGQSENAAQSVRAKKSVKTESSPNLKLDL